MTAHDGFTLHDLVSYNDKHNEANGEESRDGSNNNLSWNCGAEGPTDDAAINVLRERQKRNLLATVLLSQGVPMLLAGDEIGRTQRGNNNVYCQDNELAWTDWNIDASGRQMMEFVARMIATRRDHPIFLRRAFFQGKPVGNALDKDIVWLKPDGAEMTAREWDESFARCLGVFLSGDALQETDMRGRPVHDASFLLLFNAYHDTIGFRLPEFGQHGEWFAQIDTAFDTGRPQLGAVRGGSDYPLQGRSLALLRRIDGTQ